MVYHMINIMFFENVYTMSKYGAYKRMLKREERCKAVAVPATVMGSFVATCH
ncbi:hypothetical protein JV16_00970 [Anoxybacillus ayderensis]|uniref:Uncharacterized protein n=1 Tax=Anoxybacillus ayderensis TaxID=265546 RepID=A0A0D0G8S6_9BACL|nr:hypothetical protein C289_0471 [Anoxybacillus ayderensis]KHF30430.1 hypothetical protein LR68_00801 [Anoxybacillus sp. BCO1]KIP21770.1 hypothetical protein JV16_00970 [Anoxybacillus ayderensis]